MINNKLTKSILLIENKAIGKLNNYIQSTYAVKQTSPVVALFRIMMEYYPNFNSAEVSLEIIFAKLFPDKPFKAKKIRDLFSDLTLLLEEFLVIEYIKHNKSRFHQMKSLLHYEQGNFKDFHKEADKALVNWKDDGNIYDAIDKLSFYQHLHYYPFGEKQDQRNHFLIDANKLTDYIYVLTKLRYYCEAQTGKSIYIQAFEPTFNEEVFLMAEKLCPEYPLIDLYLSLIHLNKNREKDAYFLDTQEKFFTSFELLNKFEASVIIILLLNFCGRQYRRKKEIFIEYQFELQKFGLKHRLFSLSGNLMHTTFINILNTGAALKDITFIDSFLKERIEQLKSTHRNKCKQLGRAYEYFAKGEFAKANEIAIFLEDKSIFYSLRARYLALRCNFEFLLEDSYQKQPFLNHCQNFKVFINKQKESLAPSIRNNYLNHVSILEALTNNLIDKQILEAKGMQILNTITSTPSLVGWQYLQEKVKQLMK